MRIIVAHGPDESIEAVKGRRKTDVQEVAAVLQRAQHEVLGLAVDGTPECLRALAQAQADLVFNLVESFGGDDTKEPHVAAYYDLLGLRFTGSRRCMAFSQVFLQTALSEFTRRLLPVPGRPGGEARRMAQP